MTIIEVADLVANTPSKALQLTKRKGVLTSTWVIYKREKNYYYFDIGERFVFDENHRYTYEELIDNFADSKYEIDEEVF